VRDMEADCIRWEKERVPGSRSSIHEMVRFDDETPCQRCHYAGNPLGVAAMVLPPKGILCMPCHTATFSVDDPITLVALVIFCMGLILFFSISLSGSLSGESGSNPGKRLIRLLGSALKALFSARIIPIIRVLFWDVLLQRRLYRRSRIRWVIHALIFWPFVFRFGWGLLALLGSRWQPEWPVVWDMVNKNNPWTAFWFDITGLLLLVGIVLAFVRGALHRDRRVPGLLEQDRLALGLIGGIVVIGFVLEGMRIALTGYPPHAAYAFMGYGISLLFSTPRGLTEVYGFVWYIHAALTGAFLDPDKPILFTMARLDRIKNIAGLVEWYGRSPRLRRTANLLVIAGHIRQEDSSDWEEQAQIARMHQLLDELALDGEVRWLGRHLSKNLAGELYRYIADHGGAFAQPALFEAFGLTVIEAMTSGLPTFATSYGGPLEIIEDGVSGFHIDPNHGDRCADIIAEFFERCAVDGDYWERISRGAVERVQSRYTWELYAERMMTLSRIYGFWKYVTNLERAETRRYLEMFYSLQFRPLAKAVPTNEGGAG